MILCLRISLYKVKQITVTTPNCQIKERLFLLVWKDDTVVVASNERGKRESKKFKMKDLGQPSHYIGIYFTQTAGTVQMNQSRYIEKILERFGMCECKSRA